jgi:arginyl-tRNA synthetase
MFRQWLHNTLSEMYPGQAFDVLVPPDVSMGDYSVNLAFVLAKAEKKNPREVAQEICSALAAKGAEMIEKCEVAGPGFVNVFLKDEYLQSQLGNSEIPQDSKGKKVLVEYTQANPFKQFHIGHLMNNVLGEAIARVHEAMGADVLRINYQGDVGIHVACSVWGMMQLASEMPDGNAPASERMAFLGRAYAMGATAYKENPEVKPAIDSLNKQIYEKSDEKINELYQKGRQWSLDYFETVYARLGTAFSHYFFESEAGPIGAAIVRAHPDLFVESQGAVIFPGENYGLHSRVFINSLGLPTYEAKELGVNKTKFELYHPDLSIVITGNEINEYFKVLLKVMELVLPEVAAKTKHIGHGMLRLPTGKMSSRTGDVITAEHLIDEVKGLVSAKIRESADLDASARAEIEEQVALAAIRYPILKQGVGKDIIFDFESSISFTGDSGPYLQYTYARLANIIKKSENTELSPNTAKLNHVGERALMRHMLDFGHVIRQAVQLHTINGLALHLFELSNRANTYYEAVRINDDDDQSRKSARLVLVSAVMAQLKKGLELLGIQALERI